MLKNASIYLDMLNFILNLPVLLFSHSINFFRGKLEPHRGTNNASSFHVKLLLFKPLIYRNIYITYRRSASLVCHSNLCQTTHPHPHSFESFYYHFMFSRIYHPIYKREKTNFPKTTSFFSFVFSVQIYTFLYYAIGFPTTT